MRSPKPLRLLPPYRSAILLNRRYDDKRSMANVAYLMPDDSRSYIVAFEKVISMPVNDEYHPPREDIPTEKKIEYQIRSMKRAKQKFKNYCLANDFRYMLTLTLNPKHPKFKNLNDKNAIRKTFQNIYRNHRQTFQYLGVCETQKNGNCHLHILVTKEVEAFFSLNDHNFLQFNPWVKYGFTNIRAILPETYEKQTTYLTKYLFKQPEEHKYNYFRSKELETPKIKYNVSPYNERFKNFVIDSSFKVAYGLNITILKKG